MPRKTKREMQKERIAELEAAIGRVIVFQDWFNKIPGTMIDLDGWFEIDVRAGGGSVYPSTVLKMSIQEYKSCGAAGCLGGWTEQSPMYQSMFGEENYRNTRGDKNKLVHFFGLHLLDGYDPYSYVSELGMFSGRRHFEMSERKEAQYRIREQIQRLENQLQKEREQLK